MGHGGGLQPAQLAPRTCQNLVSHEMAVNVLVGVRPMPCNQAIGGPGCMKDRLVAFSVRQEPLLSGILLLEILQPLCLVRQRPTTPGTGPRLSR